MQFPHIIKIRQMLDDQCEPDPSGAAARHMEQVLTQRPLKVGARVAISSGSRGIHAIAAITRAVVDVIKAHGGQPFIVPAMGSHGGATAQGQERVLETLGISEKKMGAPVQANMETVVLGENDLGMPVHFSRAALDADHIVVINRIKPHTEFSGRLESGLSKMLVIGFGKREGAETAHQFAVRDGYEKVIMHTSRMILQKTSVLAGIGLVENGTGQTACVCLVEPETWQEQEEKILCLAKKKCPKLPFEALDVLLVNESGKLISGTGMDTKVIGRIMNIYEEDVVSPRITRIVLRDLAKPTDGNALGMGLADFITRKAADQINFAYTQLNCVTAVTPEKGRLPVVCDNDKKALQAAFATAGPLTEASVRFAWIHNTSTLQDMWVSPAALESIKTRAGITVLSEARNMEFTEAGELHSFAM